MKGIVLFTEGEFVVLPHQEMVFLPSRDTGGQWRATVAGPGHWFGPAFDTEAEARELCRAVAVALAEGTGGVFGEPVAEAVREAQAEPEAPSGPKIGMRVKWTGSSREDAGVVVRVHDRSGAFKVFWVGDDSPSVRSSARPAPRGPGDASRWRLGWSPSYPAGACARGACAARRGSHGQPTGRAGDGGDVGSRRIPGAVRARVAVARHGLACRPRVRGAEFTIEAPTQRTKRAK